MSTEYRTEPPIEYAVFLAACPFELQEPKEPVYIPPHMRMHLNGTYIWVFENNAGEAQFERFGRNCPDEMFEILQCRFPVKIWNEYGYPWEEER